MASTVKQALQESLVQILQPKRRVDILRDVMEAQSQRRPFVITFCGVNGVGKSTNLAKASFPVCHEDVAVSVHQLTTRRRVIDADLLLAHRERFHGADCGLRHVSCRRGGAAAHSPAAPELTASSGEARREADGPAL